ncbi:hypothetical protein JKP88DRAFT_283736 [Tribonema minus]|uniref:Uncharacterized protein n=1 Tax=Tribonema minus TaxID=303371 RepID=A0A836C6U3_9STRA|nr:hypothetical protein JKP88DRAFT_283736 [Tribonema minus]
MDGLLQRAQAWHLLACLLLTTASGTYIRSAISTQPTGSLDQRTHAPALGLPPWLLLADGVGRVAWGAACDAYGFDQPLLLAAFAQCASLWASSIAAAGTNAAALASAAFTVAHGANAAIYPVAVAAMFGSAHAGANFNVMWTGYSIAALFVALFLAGRGGDAAARQWACVLQTLGLACTAALVLGLDASQQGHVSAAAAGGQEQRWSGGRGAKLLLSDGDCAGDGKGRYMKVWGSGGWLGTGALEVTWGRRLSKAEAAPPYMLA